jgi:hypothetical protein
MPARTPGKPKAGLGVGGSPGLSGRRLPQHESVSLSVDDESRWVPLHEFATQEEAEHEAAEAEEQ